MLPLAIRLKKLRIVSLCIYQRTVFKIVELLSIDPVSFTYGPAGYKFLISLRESTESLIRRAPLADRFGNRRNRNFGCLDWHSRFGGVEKGQF